MFSILCCTIISFCHFEIPDGMPLNLLWCLGCRGVGKKEKPINDEGYKKAYAADGACRVVH